MCIYEYLLQYVYNIPIPTHSSVDWIVCIYYTMYYTIIICLIYKTLPSRSHKYVYAHIICALYTETFKLIPHDKHLNHLRFAKCIKPRGVFAKFQKIRPLRRCHYCTLYIIYSFIYTLIIYICIYIIRAHILYTRIQKTTVNGYLHNI